MHFLVKKAIDQITSQNLRGLDPQDPRAALKRKLLQDRLRSRGSKKHLITARQMQRKPVPPFVDAGMRVKQLPSQLIDPRSVNIPQSTASSIRDMVHSTPGSELPPGFPARKDLPRNASIEQNALNFRKFTRDNLAHPPSSPAIGYRALPPGIKQLYRNMDPSEGVREAQELMRNPSIGSPLSLKGRISRLLKLRGR